jgi:hypothetical protein
MLFLLFFRRTERSCFIKFIVFQTLTSELAFAAVRWTERSMLSFVISSFRALLPVTFSLTNPMLNTRRMHSRSVRVVPSSSLLSLQPMATMATPKMYLAVKGMPKKLPFKGFSWELNKALMAKNDTEMAAGAMFIQCRRERDAFSMAMLIIDVEEQMLEQDCHSASDPDGYDPEIFNNNIVSLIIMKQLEEELADLKTAKSETKPVMMSIVKVAMKVMKAPKPMKVMKAPKPMKVMKKAMKVAKSK